MRTGTNRRHTQTHTHSPPFLQRLHTYFAAEPQGNLIIKYGSLAATWQSQDSQGFYAKRLSRPTNHRETFSWQHGAAKYKHTSFFYFFYASELKFLFQGSLVKHCFLISSVYCWEAAHGRRTGAEISTSISRQYRRVQRKLSSERRCRWKGWKKKYRKHVTASLNKTKKRLQVFVFFFWFHNFNLGTKVIVTIRIPC